MNFNDLDQKFLSYILSFLKQTIDLVMIKATNKVLYNIIDIPDKNTMIANTIKQNFGRKLVIIRYASRKEAADVVVRISHILQLKPGFQHEKKNYDSIWDINAPHFFSYDSKTPAIPLHSVNVHGHAKQIYSQHPITDVRFDTRTCDIRIVDGMKLTGCTRDPYKITILLTKKIKFLEKIH